MKFKLFIISFVLFVFGFNVYALNSQYAISGKYNNLMILSVIISVIFPLVTIFLKYRKKGKFNEIINPYPPEGLNSLEFAFYYNGKITKKDVASLLLYLTNKGYIKIKEDSNAEFLEEENNKVVKSKSKFKRLKYTLREVKDNFEIIKLKEYDGDNEYEKMFFEGLFEKSDIVKKQDIKCKFYIVIDKIKEKFLKENEDKVYEKKSLRNFKISYSLMIISIISIRVILGMILGSIVVGVDIMGSGILFIAILTVIIKWLSNTSVPFVLNFAYVVGITCIIGIPSTYVMGTIVFYILNYFPNYLFVYILHCISMVIMMIYTSKTRVKTKYGLEMFGKTRGFKNFLHSVEEYELESLVDANSNYIYDILPYIYVLDLVGLGLVQHQYIQKFKYVYLEKPAWYENDISRFNFNVLNSFYNDTIEIITIYMTYSYRDYKV